MSLLLHAPNSPTSHTPLELTASRKEPDKCVVPTGMTLPTLVIYLDLWLHGGQGSVYFMTQEVHDAVQVGAVKYIVAAITPPKPSVLRASSNLFSGGITRIS